MITNITIDQPVLTIGLFAEVRNVIVNTGNTPLVLSGVSGGNNLTLAAGGRFDVPLQVTSLRVLQGTPGTTGYLQVRGYALGSQNRDDTVRKETDATYDYYGFAVPGSSTASAVWKVIRYNRTTEELLYANGNEGYENLGSGFAGMSFS